VPGVTYFKPAGIPLTELEEVIVTLDELEALRLADLNGMYQEQAAEQMKISRPTFARIVEAARKKVAEALIQGKSLRLEGGPITTQGEETMPEHDGQGPIESGRGRGHGCCGQRHGWGRGRGRHGATPEATTDQKGRGRCRRHGAGGRQVRSES